MSVSNALPLEFKPGHASSSIGGARSDIKLRNGYALSSEISNLLIEEEEDGRFMGKGKGKAKLVDISATLRGSSNCDEQWDALVAELLQAQECMQGADLEFVQDMLFADMLKIQEE